MTRESQTECRLERFFILSACISILDEKKSKGGSITCGQGGSLYCGFSINRNNGKGTFLEYVKAGNFEVDFPNLGLSVLLYEGHSDFLGHYFRHLFQMVKYVSLLDRSLFDEEDKAGYVKLLRAQMSDYEQILLYYNSLTDQGAAWNKTRGDKFPEEAGYISRFRLIKNLPPNFPLFGILPFDYYKEDANKWEKLGKKFYEHPHLPISKRALD